MNLKIVSQSASVKFVRLSESMDFAEVCATSFLIGGFGLYW